MRSSALLQLAVGLSSIGNVVASPCRPRSVIAATSAATDSATTTAVSTDISVASSVVTEALTQTSAAPTVETSSFAIIETTMTSDAIVLTTAESTAVEPTTTDFTTTTAVPTTETTSNAPMPTFTMIATGSGSVEGQGLQSSDRDGSLTAFDVRYPGWTAHSYTIDSQGRLVNDQGWFLCGKYSANNFELKRPAIVSTCSVETPSESVFLNCELSADLEVKCSIPAISCVEGSGFFSFPTCVSAVGTWDIFSLGQSGPGNTLQIGSSDGSAAYPALSMRIQKV